MKHVRLFALCLSCILFISQMPAIGSHSLSNEIASGSCGEACTWVLSKDGTLTVSGNGAMDNYNHNTLLVSPPWAEWEETINRVVIEEGITGIGDEAFYEMHDLTDISLPDSVTIIGKGAFRRSGIKSIKLPPNITEISDLCFEGCAQLEDVDLNENLQRIGWGAFYDTKRLATLYIPKSVTEIDSWAYGYTLATVQDHEYIGGMLPFGEQTIQGYPGSAAESFAYAGPIQFASVVPIAKGDVNCDGSVDVFDLALLKRYVYDAEKAPVQKQNYDVSIYKCAADINGDGYIKSQDIVSLQNWISKRTQSEPANTDSRLCGIRIR